MGIEERIGNTNPSFDGYRGCRFGSILVNMGQTGAHCHGLKWGTNLELLFLLFLF